MSEYALVLAPSILHIFTEVCYVCVMSWFYDFWLSVFHIITSFSALGVKELVLQVLVPVPEEKNYYIPQKTAVLLSFLLKGQKI